MLKRLFANNDGSIKPWVTYTFIAIAVIVGGYFIYNAWAGGDKPFQATLMCATPGCGHLRVEALKAGEMVPANCPRCGKDSLLPAFHCPKCRTVNIWNENRNLPPPTKCSKCGEEVWHGR